jgi:hypothetical protein
MTGATVGERGDTTWFGGMVGLVLGLFGYLCAAVVFGYVGLFVGGQDAGDQLASGLFAAWAVSFVASVVTVVAAIRLRRSRSGLVGLLAGTAVGLALVVLLSVRVFGVMNAVGSGCPCEPIIDQILLVPA